MRQYQLNGSGITTRKELHDALAQAMELPEYYGGNLDALMDVLTDICEDTCLTITDTLELSDNLGIYYRLLLQVLDSAEQESEYFCYELKI